MKILKFGGSSIGDAKRIKRVIEILKSYHSNGIEFSVIFSAVGGITDELIALTETASKNNSFLAKYQNIRLKHFDIVKELFAKDRTQVEYKISELSDDLLQIIQSINILKYSTARIMDSVLSFGERLSCTIISEALKKENIDCDFLDSSKLIITDSNFGKAKVDFEKTNSNIIKYFGSVNKPQIITGFIASNENGEITTLGRGGSDYTSAIFGAALNVKEIEIWTDVNGIMTADPRQVSSAIPLKAVTYHEAMEMSYFGAKVIHPPTMLPAFEKNIKIRIKNTFNPDFKGTIIREREKNVKFNAKGISSIGNISMIRIEGGGMITGNRITSRIFEKLAFQHIPALFITQGSSGLSLCIGILPENTAEAEKLINHELKLEMLEGDISPLVIENNLALLAVVGEDMRATPGISGTIFDSLGKNGINIKAIAQGSSELNVSFVIQNSDLKKALNVVHNAMFLSETKVNNIFLAGPGLVGSRLIEYFIEKREFLKEKYSSEIRVLGLANSGKMLFSEGGIELTEWKSRLQKSQTESNPQNFISEMIKMNRANSIFADCTAANSFVPFYNQILENNIAVVTPNKIANTGSFELYKSLRANVKKHGVPFYYSTNVGAALPVISVINELISAGEEIISVEAILSGSLSFIFNEFQGNRKLTDVIAEAKEKGFTEPDPRDDLSGLDSARKLLIILREAGQKIELKNIRIENLVPEEARNKNISVDEFFNIMKNYDPIFSDKKFSADKAGNKLKYIASYNYGEARVGLKSISETHPFYTLKGTENIVSIKTANHDIPLVIRGKGAGAKYTAFGIFSDIIKIIK